jgi:cytochrome c2
MSAARATATAIALALAGCASGCARDSGPAPRVVGGDAELGRKSVAKFQCGACHVIPGIRGARGRVGPTLERFRHRVYLAGKWPNEPELVVRWLVDPPSMAPLTAMPSVGATDEQARDMAAYLYTLE